LQGQALPSTLPLYTAAALHLLLWFLPAYFTTSEVSLLIRERGTKRRDKKKGENAEGKASTSVCSEKYFHLLLQRKSMYTTYNRRIKF